MKMFLFKKKIPFFYTGLLDPIRAYFFRNSVLSLNQKNQTKQTSVYFPSFPSCIPIHLLNFTAKFGKSCLHFLLLFLPLSSTEQPSLIWISPHSSIKTLLQRLPVIFLVFNSRRYFVLFILRTFQRCVEILSPSLGFYDASLSVFFSYFSVYSYQSPFSTTPPPPNR